MMQGGSLDLARFAAVPFAFGFARNVLPISDIDDVVFDEDTLRVGYGIYTPRA